MVFYGITMDESLAKRKDQIVDTINRRFRMGSFPRRVRKGTEKQTQREAETRVNPIISISKLAKAFGRAPISRSQTAHALARLSKPPASSKVAIVPAQQEIKFDLGDWLPDKGDLRVRIRASRTSSADDSYPSLRLFFGFQASNNSEGIRRIGNRDMPVKAPPGEPKFYEWTIPLGETPRNLFRGIQKMGEIPNPTEFLEFQNVHQDTSKGSTAAVQIQYVEVIAPIYKQWPPESHTRIFIDSGNENDENRYAREVLAFMHGLGPTRQRFGD